MSDKPKVTAPSFAPIADDAGKPLNKVTAPSFAPIDLSRKPTFGAVDKVETFFGEFKHSNLAVGNTDEFIRASSQPWSSQAFNAMVAGVGTGVIKAAEGVVAIAESVANLAGSAPYEWSMYAAGLKSIDDWEKNSIQKSLGSARESVDRAFPIYQENPDAVFDFGDSASYWNGVKNIVSSAVEFGIPGGVIGKGVNVALKGLAKLPKLAKRARDLDTFMESTRAADNLQKVVGSLGAGFVTNHLEGTVMGYHLYESELENQLSLGIPFEQAAKNAAEAASDLRFKNRAFMLTDAFALSGIIRGGVRATNNIIKNPSIKNVLATGFKNNIGEGIEEIAQGVIQSEEEFDALVSAGLVKDDGDLIGRLTDAILKPETLYEGALGFFGGALQAGTAKVTEGIGKKSEVSRQQRYQQQQGTIAKTQQYVASKLQNLSDRAQLKQEALLSDNSYGVYATIIEDNEFIEIVAENFRNGTVSMLERTIDDFVGTVNKGKKSTNPNDVGDVSLVGNEQYRKVIRELENQYLFSKRFLNSDEVFEAAKNRYRADATINSLKQDSKVKLNKISEEGTKIINAALKEEIAKGNKKATELDVVIPAEVITEYLSGNESDVNQILEDAGITTLGVRKALEESQAVKDYKQSTEVLQKAYESFSIVNKELTEATSQKKQEEVINEAKVQVKEKIIEKNEEAKVASKEQEKQDNKVNRVNNPNIPNKTKTPEERAQNKAFNEEHKDAGFYINREVGNVSEKGKLVLTEIANRLIADPNAELTKSEQHFKSNGIVVYSNIQRELLKNPNNVATHTPNQPNPEVEQVQDDVQDEEQEVVAENHRTKAKKALTDPESTNDVPASVEAETEPAIPSGKQEPTNEPEQVTQPVYVNKDGVISKVKVIYEVNDDENSSHDFLSNKTKVGDTFEVYINSPNFEGHINLDGLSLDDQLKTLYTKGAITIVNSDNDIIGTLPIPDDKVQGNTKRNEKSDVELQFRTDVINLARNNKNNRVKVRLIEKSVGSYIWDSSNYQLISELEEFTDNNDFSLEVWLGDNRYTGGKTARPLSPKVAREIGSTAIVFKDANGNSVANTANNLHIKDINDGALFKSMNTAIDLWYKVSSFRYKNASKYKNNSNPEVAKDVLNEVELKAYSQVFDKYGIDLAANNGIANYLGTFIPNKATTKATALVKPNEKYRSKLDKYVQNNIASFTKGVTSKLFSAEGNSLNFMTVSFDSKGKPNIVHKSISPNTPQDSAIFGEAMNILSESVHKLDKEGLTDNAIKRPLIDLSNADNPTSPAFPTGYRDYAKTTVKTNLRPQKYTSKGKVKHAFVKNPVVKVTLDDSNLGNQVAPVSPVQQATTPNTISNVSNLKGISFRAINEDAEIVGSTKNIVYGNFSKPGQGEDSISIDIDKGVYALSDGMGGESMGTFGSAALSTAITNALVSGKSLDSLTIDDLVPYADGVDAAIEIYKAIAASKKDGVLLKDLLDTLEPITKTALPRIKTNITQFALDVYQGNVIKSKLGATSLVAKKVKEDTYEISKIGDTVYAVVNSDGSISESNGMATTAATDGIVFWYSSSSNDFNTVVGKVDTFTVKLKEGQKLFLSTDFIETKAQLSKFMVDVNNGNINLSKFIKENKFDDASFVVINHSLDTNSTNTITTSTNTVEDTSTTPTNSVDISRFTEDSFTNFLPSESNDLLENSVATITNTLFIDEFTNLNKQQDIVQGIGTALVTKLLSKNPNKEFDTDSVQITVKEIKEVFDSYHDKFTGIRNGIAAKTPDSLWVKHFDGVLNNWNKVQELTSEWISQQTGVVINDQLLEDINLDALSFDKEIHDDYHGFSVDPKNKLSLRVKLFLASVPSQTETYYGDTKAVPATEVYNTILGILSNSPDTHDFSDLLNDLATYSDSIDWLPEVLGRLSKSSNAFKNAFTVGVKKVTTSMKEVHLNDGNVSVVQTNSNELKYTILNNWYNNAEVRGALIDNEETGGLKYNPEVFNPILDGAFNIVNTANGGIDYDITINNFTKSFKSLGVDLDPAIIKTMIDNGLALGTNKVYGTDIAGIIKSEFDSGTGNISYDGEKSYFSNSIFSKLAEVQATYEHTINPSAHRSGVKTVFSYTDYRRMSARLIALKNDKQLLTNLTKQAYSSSSLWLRRLLKTYPDGSFILENDQVVIDYGSEFFGTFEHGIASLQVLKKGNKNVDNKLSNLNDIDHLQTKVGFHNNNNSKAQIMFHPTMSDKSTMGLITSLKLSADINVLDSTGALSDDAISYLYKSLFEPDFKRMKQITEAINDKGFSEDNYPASYLQGYGMFYSLPGLNFKDELFHGKNTDLLYGNREVKDISSNPALREIVEAEIRSVFNKELEGLLTSQVSLNKRYLAASGNDIKGSLANFAFDYFINNSEIQQLFIGDPANFYKGKVKKTIKENYVSTKDNLGKRLAAEASTRTSGNNIKKSTTIIVIPDIEQSSFDLEYKKELLGDLAEAYENISVLDAQEYASPKYYADLLLTNGFITDDIHSKIITLGNKDELTVEETKELSKVFKETYFGAQKPVHRVNKFNEQTNVEEAYFVKSSIVPLFPALTKQFEINKLAKAMVENDIDRAITTTALKLGIPDASKIFEAFNPDGSVKDILTQKEHNEVKKLLTLEDKRTEEQEDRLEELENKLSLSDIDSNYKIELPNEGLGLQLTVPNKSGKEQIVGSQSMKLITAGLDGSDGYSLRGVGDNLTIDEVRNEMTKTTNRLINLQYDSLLDEVLVDDQLDIRKLADVLKKEAASRGYNVNYKFVLDDIRDGTFYVPLWSTSDSAKYEALMLSLVKNKVHRITVPREDYVLQSAEGYTIKDIQGATILTTNADLSDGKLHATRKVGSVLKGNQILIPATWKTVDGKKIDFTKMVNSDGILEVDDPSILEVFGFRIPTSGHNSMAYMEVAGFLPERMGNTVIAPRDLIEQMGWDFDVDKLNTYTPFKFIKNGKLARLEEASRDHLIGMYRNMYVKDVQFNDLKDALNNEQYQKETLDNLYSLHGQTPEITFEQFLEDIEFKKLKNKLIDIHIAIVSNPNPIVQQKIAKPLSYGELANVAKEVADSTALDSIMSERYQRTKYLNGKFAKSAVGIYSSLLVTQAFIQGKGTSEVIGGVFTRKSRVKLDKLIANNPNKDPLILAAENNLETISDTISALQNAAVDNESQQILHKLNIDEHTVDISTGMALLGYDSKQIAQFMSSGYVAKYSEFMELFGDADTAVTSTENFFKENKQEGIVLAKKGGKDIGHTLKVARSLITNSVAAKDEIGNIAGAFSTSKFPSTMEDFMARKQKIDTLIVENPRLFLDIIPVNYEQADEQAEQLVPEGYILYNNLYVLTENYGAATTLAAMDAARSMYLDHKEAFFFHLNPNYINVHQEVQNYVNDGTFSAAKTTKLHKVISKGFKSFLFSNAVERGYLQGEDQKAAEQRLLFSKGKFAKKVLKFKDTFTNNPFLKVIYVNLKTKSTTYTKQSTINFSASTGERLDENHIISGILDLITNPQEINGYSTKDLVKDLVSYSYLSGGIQEASEFIKFIPVPYLKELGFYDNIVPDNLNAVRAADQIIRNNIDIVPVIDSIGELIQQGINPYVSDEIPVFNNAYVFNTTIEYSTPKGYINIIDTRDNATLPNHIFKYNEKKNIYKRVSALGGSNYSEYAFNVDKKESNAHKNNIISVNIAKAALEKAVQAGEYKTTKDNTYRGGGDQIIDTTPVSTVNESANNSDFISKLTELAERQDVSEDKVALLNSYAAKLKSANFNIKFEMVNSIKFNDVITKNGVPMTVTRDADGSTTINPETNEVIVKIRRIADNPEKQARVFIHEAGHALIDLAIHNHKNGNGVPPEVAEAIDSLAQYHEIFKGYVNANTTHLGFNYTATNLNEFINGIMESAELRQHLSHARLGADNTITIGNPNKGVSFYAKIKSKVATILNNIGINVGNRIYNYDKIYTDILTIQNSVNDISFNGFAPQVNNQAQQIKDIVSDPNAGLTFLGADDTNFLPSGINQDDISESRFTTIFKVLNLQLDEINKKLAILKSQNATVKINKDIEELNERKQQLLTITSNLSDDVNVFQIIEQGKSDLEYIKGRLAKGNMLSSGELIHMEKLAKMWSDITDTTGNVYGNPVLTPEEVENEALIELISPLTNEFADASTKLYKLIENRGVQIGKNFTRKGVAVTAKDLLSPFKDVGAGIREFLDSRKTDNPLIDLIIDKINQANFNLRTNNSAKSKNYDTLFKAAEAAAKSLGTTVNTLFTAKDSKGRNVNRFVTAANPEYYKKLDSYFDEDGRFKVTKQKEYTKFKSDNTITVDVRKILPTAVGEDYHYADDTFTEAQVQEHLDELRENVGQKGLDILLEKQRKLVEQFKESYTVFKNSVEQQQDLTNEQKEDIIKDFEIENSPYYKSRSADLAIGIANKAGKTIYPKSKYSVNHIRKFKKGTTTETGYIDNAFETIKNNESLFEFYQLMLDINERALRIIPNKQSQGYGRNSFNLLTKTFTEDVLMAKNGGVNSAFNKLQDSFRDDKEVLIDRDPLSMSVNSNNIVNSRKQEIRDLVDLKLVEFVNNNGGRTITDQEAQDIKEDALAEVVAKYSNDLSKAMKAMMLLSETYRHKVAVEDNVNLLNHLNSKRQYLDTVGNLQSDAIKSNTQEMLNYFVGNFYGLPSNEVKNVSKNKTFTKDEAKYKAKLEEQITKLKAAFKRGEINQTVYNTLLNKLEDQKASLGKGVSFSSTLANIIKFFQLKTMGWNATSGVANVGFGTISNFREAASGRFFTDAQMTKAYQLMGHSIKNYYGSTSDVSQKITNLMEKLGVLSDSTNEMYDINKGDYNGTLKKALPYEITKSTEFLNQAPIMIAKLMNIQVGDTNLWELYDKDGNLPEGVDVSEYKIAANISAIRDELHGNYDGLHKQLQKKSDLGKVLLMYRTWMLNGIDGAWGAARYNESLGVDTKGRYRSLGALGANENEKFEGEPTFLKKLQNRPILRNISFVLKEAMTSPLRKVGVLGKDNINDYYNSVDAANIRMLIRDTHIYLAMYGTYVMLELLAADLDPEDRDYLYGMMNTITRMETDILLYFNPNEFETLNSDIIPLVKIFRDFKELNTALYRFAQGDDEIKSGIFAGDSRLTRETLQFIPLGSQIYRTANYGARLFE